MKKKIFKLLSLMLTAVLVFTGIPIYAITSSVTRIKAPEGGTVAVSWDSFYKNAVSNSSVYTTVTKNENGSGLLNYQNYIRAEVKELKYSDTTGKLDYSGRALNYYDTNGTYGFKGTVASGEALLFHVICRSSEASGKFRLAAYGAKTGDTPSEFKDESVSSRWMEYFIPATAKTGDYFKINFRIGHILQTVDVAYFEVINYGSDVAAADLPYTMTVLDDSEYSFEREESTVDFYSSLNTDLISGTVSYNFTEEELSSVQPGDMLLFSFVAKANTVCTPIDITIKQTKNTNMRYFVPVQWTRIYMPITATALKGITLATDGEISISEAKFENRLYATFEDLSLLSGMHLLEEFKYVPLGEDSYAGAGACKDIVKNGDFVYSIGNGTLCITDVSGDSPVIAGKVSGLGNNIRQVDLTSDGNYAIVTSRENGAFVVNVQDPTAPYIATIYDTVEYGNGITISGNYAFICNRQYGVEIVDITDILNPVHLSIVHAGEVQSCELVNGILYCGLWGECRVDMYDVTNPNAPEFLGSAKLNGKGDGMSVCEVDGKTYLYAATGQHTLSLNVSTPLSDLRYGQGNGLDIFDVTDPCNPVWLSTSKIDGRYYFVNNDYWDTEVSVFDNRVYVYMLNTYNGVFVYDATDPAAPVRLAHIDVPISSSQAAKTSLARAIIFPYDQSISARSPIGAIVVEEGAMYLAGALTDLHVYRDTDYLYNTFEFSTSAPIESEGENYYAFDSSGLQGFKRFATSGQIYSAVSYENKIFLAAGSEGIIVLDENLNRLNTVSNLTSLGICHEIKISGGKLYAAEGNDGLVIYDINGTELVNAKQYVSSSGGHCRGVALSKTAKFAMLQIGSGLGEIINTETLKKLISQTTTTQMYHRNVASIAEGRYLGFWGAGGKEFWYDCGENEAATATPTLIANYTTTSVIWNGGLTDYNGMALSGYSGSISIYMPSGGSSAITYDSQVSIGTNPDGFKRTGKPTVYGNTLILTDRAYGYIYIYDITDIKSPLLLKEISVNGNPDFAIITEDYIMIPMGYQGLFKFGFESFDTRPGVHSHCICGGTSEGLGSHVCSEQGFTAWTDSTKLPTESGYYYLLCDVDLISSGQQGITTGADVTLCLNGHTITRSNTSSGVNGRIYALYGVTDITLNICDCKGGGNITSKASYKNQGGTLWLHSPGGTVNIFGGTIRGYDAPSDFVKNGSTVSIETGTLNLYGGIIVAAGEASTLAGGSGSVYIGKNAGFNMYGGSIIRTEGSETVGSTLFVAGSFNMSGGTVSGGSAEHGGAVYVAEGGSITLSGDACVNGNTSNIYLASGSALTVNTLAETASFGIAVEDESEPFAFADVSTAPHFTADLPGYSVLFFAGKLYIGIIGDVNRDGTVDVQDGRIITQYVIKLIELDDRQLAAADLNADGQINIGDAVLTVTKTY